jgi:hypothetical protein
VLRSTNPAGRVVGSGGAARAMPVLSAADLCFFEAHGYVVARGAVSPAQAARTAAEAWLAMGDTDIKFQLSYAVHLNVLNKYSYDRMYL